MPRPRIARLAEIDRRWIFLAVFLFVLVPLVKPVRMPVAIGGPSRRFYEAIESIPNGSVVIMPFDYEPAFMAETHPMAVAVLRRLLEKDCRVLSPSMQFAGPPMADLAWQQVGPPLGKRYGVDFVNLGYKSGNEALVLSMGQSIRGAYPLDSHGTPAAQLPIMQSIDRLGDTAMLVEIAATSAANIWIEQAQGRFHLRMVAGVTGVMGPEFFPYLQAGQVRGLLSGMAGAAEYEALLAKPGTATKGMDAQSLVHLFLVALIVAGNGLEWRTRGRRGVRGAGGAGGGGSGTSPGAGGPGPPSPGPAGPGAALLILLAGTALAAAGCGGNGHGGRSDAPAAGGARAEAPPDTSRQGRTVIVAYESGPMDELRIVRDTAGGIVVHGASGFPDGTRITIALLGAGDKPEILAVTRPVVRSGRFEAEPLVPLAGPPPAGRVRLRFGASFAPGEQPDEVLTRSARGRNYHGRGMIETKFDYAIYSENLEVEL